MWSCGEKYKQAEQQRGTQMSDGYTEVSLDHNVSRVDNK
jgi:hypothetical protein